jgi:hypothetical protein
MFVLLLLLLLLLLLFLIQFKFINVPNQQPDDDDDDDDDDIHFARGMHHFIVFSRLLLFIKYFKRSFYILIPCSLVVAAGNTRFNNQKFCILSAEYSSVFCMVFRTNSNYFSAQQ